MTLHVGFKLSKLFVLNNIICVDTTIQRWWEKSIFIGKLNISNCRFMLLKSSQTITTDFIPYLYFSIISSSGDEFMIIEMDSLSLVNETFLVKNITLRLPLPNYDLPKCFKSKTYPCSRCIDCQCTDLVLSNWECLDFCQLLFYQLENRKLSFTVSTSQKSIIWIVWHSFEILTRLSDD